MNTRHIPIRSLPIQTDAMRRDQIQSHTIIAMGINVLRLKRIAQSSRSPLDRRDWLAAEGVYEDALDGIAGRYRSDPPPQESAEWPWPWRENNLITGGGEP